MNDITLLGPWVRRFLLEHLVAERNMARNTQRSYRDALKLLGSARESGKPPGFIGFLRKAVSLPRTASVAPISRSQ